MREENTVSKEIHMLTKVDLSMIVAMVAKSQVIGKNGRFPWGYKKLPGYFTRFQEVTLGKNLVKGQENSFVIMGRPTHESIIKQNKRTLLDRIHIVLTKKKLVGNYYVRFVGSIGAALKEIAMNGGRGSVMGGGKVFDEFFSLPQVKRMYVTTVHAKLEGDVYFPEISEKDWECVNTPKISRFDLADEYETSFAEYRRVTK